MDIATTRKALGIGIPDLAHISGVHRNTIYKMERGEVEASFAVVFVLELALRILQDKQHASNYAQLLDRQSEARRAFMMSIALELHS